MKNRHLFLTAIVEKLIFIPLTAKLFSKCFWFVLFFRLKIPHGSQFSQHSAKWRLKINGLKQLGLISALKWIDVIWNWKWSKLWLFYVDYQTKLLGLLLDGPHIIIFLIYSIKFNNSQINTILYIKFNDVFYTNNNDGHT